MAFETISLGTQPAGTGGDTARTAFEKVNRNFIAADVLAAAMSQAQFEANRNANKERYAASGWVSFGNHESGKQVNECKPGLYTALTTPNTLLIGKAGGVGGSKADHGVLHIAGVIFHLPLAYPVKLAQAPDGKTTYNKSTGAILNHATAVAAFNAAAADPVNIEVVTDRIDMWGFEAFAQEVTQEKPEIYPYGVFDTSLTFMNGIATSDSVRPNSYFGWLGAKAKKLDYFSLTNEQKKKVLSDPNNNLYLSDEGKLIQRVLRGREFAGSGNGDWECIEPSSSNAKASFMQNVSCINPQGSSDIVISLVSSSSLNAGGFNTIQNDPAIYKINDLDSSISIKGECYLLVCGTVNRLNTGCYQQSFNPSGSGKVVNSASSGWVTWNEDSAKKSVIKLDYFKPYEDGGLNDKSKFVGSLAGGQLVGRSDLRYFDVIYGYGYGGVCRDMRYPAKKITESDRSVNTLSLNNGTFRGFEHSTFTKPINGTSNGEVGSFGIYYNDSLPSLGLFNVSIVNGAPSGIKIGSVQHFHRNSDNAILSGIVLAVSPTVISLRLKGEDNPAWRTYPAQSTLGYTWFCQTNKQISVGGSFLHTDVYGFPLNISLTDMLSDGWQGCWIPQILSGPSSLTACRKNIITSCIAIYTSNNGVSWSAQSSFGFDSVSNTTAAINSGDVAIIQYQAFAYQTEPCQIQSLWNAQNSIGNVHSGKRYSINKGALICESMIKKVLVSDSSGGHQNRIQPLTSFNIWENGFLSSDPNDDLEHVPVSLIAPLNSSPAIKYLDFGVCVNRKVFTQLAYSELKYTGGSWGDDGKIKCVSGQETKTDTNGKVVLIGMSRAREHIGFDMGKV